MTVRAWAKEHRWLFGLSVGLVACLVAECALLVYLGGLRDLSRRHSERAAEMDSIAAEYRAIKARTESGLNRVSSFTAAGLNPVDVERVARENGITNQITETSVQTFSQGEDLEEQVLSMSFSGIRRKSLADFLAGVERMNPAIRIKELRIFISRKQPSLIDANVKLSAYGKKSVTSASR